MPRNVSLRRARPPPPVPPGGYAAALQVQEFVRLYLEVDERGRRLLAHLVRRSAAGRPQRPAALH